MLGAPEPDFFSPAAAVWMRDRPLRRVFKRHKCYFCHFVFYKLFFLFLFKNTLNEKKKNSLIPSKPERKGYPIDHMFRCHHSSIRFYPYVDLTDVACFCTIQLYRRRNPLASLLSFIRLLPFPSTMRKVSPKRTNTMCKVWYPRGHGSVWAGLGHAEWWWLVNTFSRIKMFCILLGRTRPYRVGCTVEPKFSSVFLRVGIFPRKCRMGWSEIVY